MHVVWKFTYDFYLNRNVEKNVTKSRLMKIYHDVCIILKLIDNDDEWHVVMTKILILTRQQCLKI